MRDTTLASKPGPAGVPVNVSIDNGTIQGREWFDLDSEMVVENISDQTMALKILTQGKTINSQMKQNVAMKLVEVVDIPK